MSNTTSSIAGVRPQGLLARACVPSAVAWRGRCGAGANHGAGHGSALFSCASALGARPRVVQTESRQKLRTQAMSAAAHGPELLASTGKRRRTANCHFRKNVLGNCRSHFSKYLGSSSVLRSSGSEIVPWTELSPEAERLYSTLLPRARPYAFRPVPRHANAPVHGGRAY